MVSLSRIMSCSSSLPFIKIPSSLVEAKLLLPILWNSIMESYLKLALSSRWFAPHELQKQVLELLHFSQPGKLIGTGCFLSRGSQNHAVLFLLFSSVSTTHSYTSTKVSTFLSFL